MRRSPRTRQPDCPDSAARARNADYSASQRIIQARYDTYYEYAAEGQQTKPRYNFKYNVEKYLKKTFSF